MNSIDLKKAGIQVTERKPKYVIRNEEVIMFVGKDKRLEDKFKSLPILNVGPDGILCSDDNETFITWDRMSETY